MTVLILLPLKLCNVTAKGSMDNVRKKRANICPLLPLGRWLGGRAKIGSDSIDVKCIKRCCVIKDVDSSS